MSEASQPVTSRLEEGSGSRGPCTSRHPVLAAIAYGVCYLVTGVMADWGAAQTTSPLALWSIIAAVGVVTLACAVLLALSVCRIRLRPGAEVAGAAVFLAAFLLQRPAVLGYACRWLGRGEQVARALSGLPTHPAAGNMALILWAIFLGRVVSRLIREGKLLLPVAVVASLADVITVFHGVVAKMSETAPEVVEAFSATLPVATPVGVSVPVLTAVGIGDFLFLALFLSVTLRYSMNAARAAWGAFAAMLVAPFAFLIWPQAPGMPGLPFISAGVLAANWRHLRYSSAERRALAVTGALVVGALVVAWAAWRA